MTLHKEKYKAKTLFGRLRMKWYKLTTSKFEQEVMIKHQIDEDSYDYLNRHLIKINKALRGVNMITLNKLKDNGRFVYTAVITLKVQR